MRDPQTFWLARLRDLHPYVDRKKGPGRERYAPHKPLLLLSLIELAEAGELPPGPLPLSAGLRVRFMGYWQIVVRRWTTRPDIRMPFYYLSTQGFWTPRREDGTPAKDADSTATIDLDAEFLGLLAQPLFREIARHALLQTWFPDVEQAALYALLGMDRRRGADVIGRIAEEEAEYARRTGRDARFRIQVVSGYRYTCALTGYTLTAARTGATMVEAAHIADFASTRNNDPRNGLALCPNAHWAFDEGLWGVAAVGEAFRVVIADRAFAEPDVPGLALGPRAGQRLIFAPGTTLRPAPEFFRVHLDKTFAG